MNEQVARDPRTEAEIAIDWLRDRAAEAKRDGRAVIVTTEWAGVVLAEIDRLRTASLPAAHTQGAKP